MALQVCNRAILNIFLLLVIQLISLQVLCSNATKIQEHKTWRMQSGFCTWQNSVMGQEPPKMYITVPAQETAKHRAKFGCLPLSDIAAVTLPRRETR